MYTLSVPSGAYNALRILAGIDREKNENINRLSTGLRIREASNNPSMWSVATAARSQVNLTSTVAESMNTTIGAVTVASQATERLLPLLNRFRDLLVAGRDETTGRRAMQTEMDDLKQQMLSIVRSASFNGVNLLFHRTGQSYNLTTSTGVSSSGEGSVPITETIDTTGLTLVDEVATNGVMSRPYNYGAGTWRRLFDEYGGNAFRIGLFQNATTPATGFSYEASLGLTNRIITDVNTVAARLGAMKARFEGQQSFLKQLSDIQTTAIGRMVDANMLEEQTRSKAIEAREKLAYEGLAIANNRHKLVLQLFSPTPSS
ncbi:flagellin N-terminal helical domain-containing protein [Gellertiella hungarica]|uniref:Flagellin n=1 Tax=Gellertiella hungarica TaxID=1572859 RepID=A0A7W6NI98_9HYPH|nr:flagellin [Gellertiella hungarica]MBB4063155.1 flagellin [Gellertiella hungarica]